MPPKPTFIDLFLVIQIPISIIGLTYLYFDYKQFKNNCHLKKEKKN